MAERRMFAKKIIDSDAFLDMPLSTQALYFHLAMRADDDGFVNSPRKIVRLIGAAEDDLRLLITKRFILAFESGVVVIKHWWMHNTLRSDRYHPTDYQEEFALLGLKQNRAYTDDPAQMIPETVEQAQEPDGFQDGAKLATNGIQDGNQPEPQYKRIQSNRNKIKSNETVSSDFDAFWSAYPKKVGKEAARKAFEKAKQPVDVLIEAIEKQKRSDQWTREGGRFIPNPATWLNQGRWQDELAPAEQKGGKNFAPACDPKSYTVEAFIFDAPTK